MLLALTSLRELGDDTAVAAGNEAHTAGLEVYCYVNANDGPSMPCHDTVAGRAKPERLSHVGARDACPMQGLNSR